MHTDSQGHALSGATPGAAALYREAVEAFNLFRGDPVGLLNAAVDEAPGFAMAHLLKAHLLALTTEAGMTRAAREILQTVRGLALDAREAGHLAALEALVAGEWTAAARALDRHLMEWPRDIVALQSGHNMDFFRGDARDLRDRVARALPSWSPEDPGHSVVLGMYAFGLEEAGDYGRAEAVGREACAREPRDAWAHHAVAHVLEMEGRAAEGVAWMEERAAWWADEAVFFRVHNWWHKALCHLELGDPAAALAVYDDHVMTGPDALALNLLDASALLWRLDLGGTDASDRWARLAEAWEPHLQGTGYPFNDWHAAMAFLGAGRIEEADRLLAVQRAGGPGETGRWAREIGAPLIAGFRAFRLGDHAGAVEALHPVRYAAQAFGGSHAQRDVIDWTLTEAAVRGGLRGVAEALAHERLALRPHSPVNRRFLARAEALPQPA